MLSFRTFHNYLGANHKTMDHTQGQFDSHLNLSPGQSIQLLDYGVYLNPTQ